MAPQQKLRKIAIVGSRSVGRSSSLPLRERDSTRLEADQALGKSSLTVQFVEKHFVESYYPTIENTFSAIIKINKQEYATEIIDTAGQVCPLYSDSSKVVFSFS